MTFLVLINSLFDSLQLAAIPLLDPEHCRQERVSHSSFGARSREARFDVYFFSSKFQVALQKHFKKKRDHVLARLEKLGLKVAIPPTSTFYIWLNLEKLPAPINNGLVRPFHRLAFREKNPDQ